MATGADRRRLRGFEPHRRRMRGARAATEAPAHRRRIFPAIYRRRRGARAARAVWAVWTASRATSAALRRRSAPSRLCSASNRTSSARRHLSSCASRATSAAARACSRAARRSRLPHASPRRCCARFFGDDPLLLRGSPVRLGGGLQRGQPRAAALRLVALRLGPFSSGLCRVGSSRFVALRHGPPPPCAAPSCPRRRRLVRSRVASLAARR